MNVRNVLTDTIQELRRLGSHKLETIVDLETILARASLKSLSSDIDDMYNEIKRLRTIVIQASNLKAHLLEKCTEPTKYWEERGMKWCAGERKAYGSIKKILNLYTFPSTLKELSVYDEDEVINVTQTRQEQDKLISKLTEVSEGLGRLSKDIRAYINYLPLDYISLRIRDCADYIDWYSGSVRLLIKSMKTD